MLEAWAPMGSNQRPAYSNKPKDDLILTFAFIEGGELKVVDRLGFSTVLYRNVTD